MVKLHEIVDIGGLHLFSVKSQNLSFIHSIFNNVNVWTRDKPLVYQSSLPEFEISIYDETSTIRSMFDIRQT